MSSILKYKFCIPDSDKEKEEFIHSINTIMKDCNFEDIKNLIDGNKVPLNYIIDDHTIVHADDKSLTRMY